jgi:hypothetical protein
MYVASQDHLNDGQWSQATLTVTDGVIHAAAYVGGWDDTHSSTSY